MCYGATSTHVPVMSVRQQTGSRTWGAPEKWVTFCQSQERDVSLSYVQCIIIALLICVLSPVIVLAVR